MKVLILCAGDASRFDGQRKQLLKVDNESIVERTLRLFRARGVDDIMLVVRPEDHAFDHIDAPREVARLNSNNFEADRFVSSRHLWSTKKRTVIVYGDVYFTEHAVQRIVNDNVPSWRVYGRPMGSPVTGCKHGEIFALSWWPAQHATVDRKLAYIIELQRRGIINRTLGWELFRALCGLRDRRVRSPMYTPMRRLVVINDETEDFDRPGDYNTWLTLRKRRQLRRS